jgi:hypothetical protein
MRGSELKGPSPLAQIGLGMVAAFMLCYLVGPVRPAFAADLMIGLVPLGAVIAWLNTWLVQRRPELVVEDWRPNWAAPAIAGAGSVAVSMLVAPLLIQTPIPRLETRDPLWTVESGRTYRIQAPDEASYRLTAVKRMESGPVLTVSGTGGTWNSNDDALMGIDALDGTAVNAAATDLPSSDDSALPSVGPMTMPSGTFFCAGRDNQECLGGGTDGAVGSYLFGWLGRDRRRGVTIGIRVQREPGR